MASITCPQALLSFQWGAGEGIGTSHPITMSLSQCTTGFRTSALSYGTGTITTTTGTSVFQNNNEFGHYHVSLSITVPDVALGPATVTRDFDVEAAYLTGFYPLYLGQGAVLVRLGDPELGHQLPELERRLAGHQRVAHLRWNEPGRRPRIEQLYGRELLEVLIRRTDKHLAHAAMLALTRGDP